LRRPSPSLASAAAGLGPEFDPAVDIIRKAELRQVSPERRALSDVPQACMLVTIDLWPDDWAASLRTAGRTFRLPLQMIEILPAPTLRVRRSCTLL
jgi:hypothetical protein